MLASPKKVISRCLRKNRRRRVESASASANANASAPFANLKKDSTDKSASASASIAKFKKDSTDKTKFSIHKKNSTDGKQNPVAKKAHNFELGIDNRTRTQKTTEEIEGNENQG